MRGFYREEISCKVLFSLVEPGGIEPPTSCMPCSKLCLLVSLFDTFLHLTPWIHCLSFVPLTDTICHKMISRYSIITAWAVRPTMRYGARSRRRTRDTWLWSVPSRAAIAA